MTYTETIIARKIGSYIFTLLALSVISLMLLNVMKAIMIIAYIINIILACILFGLMIRRFLKT